MAEKFFNTHAHCFTLDHIPEKFFDELIGGKRFLRISKIKGSPFLRRLIKIGTGRFFRAIVRLFSHDTAKKMRRLHGLIKYSADKKQEELIDNIFSLYGADYKIVFLSMDMEYMFAGPPLEKFISQLDKLKEIKDSANYANKILPFIFADPRRDNITQLVKDHLLDKTFQGIKLYPAVGYFPFDRNLKEIYKFAIEHDVPLITHCIIGDVYNRNKNLWKEHPVHPLSGKSTFPSAEYKVPQNFQYNFTHPLNYECLLNPEYARKAFGDDSIDFSKLKICIGHFGGEDEWGIHKKQDKKKDTKYKSVYKWNPLDINQPWLGKPGERYNWLTIIQALLYKYPNVHADISFTLSDPDIYPELKKMLINKDIRSRILFGTDFYVVASVASESDIIKLVRNKLSDAEFKLIAYDNPVKFLSSGLNKI